MGASVGPRLGFGGVRKIGDDQAMVLLILGTELHVGNTKQKR